MPGKPGRSGPPGNKNAAKHNFYADAIMSGEENAFEEAKTLSIDNEIALLRLRVLRYAKFEAEGGEVTENTKGDVERAMGRLRDMMMAKSLIQRNERESGQGDDGDFDRFVDVATRTGAHRTTFKTNGNGKARNGSG